MPPADAGSAPVAAADREPAPHTPPADAEVPPQAFTTAPPATPAPADGTPGPAFTTAPPPPRSGGGSAAGGGLRSGRCPCRPYSRTGRHAARGHARTPRAYAPAPPGPYAAPPVTPAESAAPAAELPALPPTYQAPDGYGFPPPAPAPAQPAPPHDPRSGGQWPQPRYQAGPATGGAPLGYTAAVELSSDRLLRAKQKPKPTRSGFRFGGKAAEAERLRKLELIRTPVMSCYRSSP
ncbi:hypothetical protein ACFSNO_29790 [Streptomyces cirratus]